MVPCFPRCLNPLAQTGPPWAAALADWVIYGMGGSALWVGGRLTFLGGGRVSLLNRLH